MSRKVLTFVDAGVLIAAARGAGAKALATFPVLDDPDREFASSLYVRLEVLPKAVYNKQLAEEGFYGGYFAALSHRADPVDILEDALAAGAHELVTTEGAAEPTHRAAGVEITAV